MDLKITLLLITLLVGDIALETLQSADIEGRIVHGTVVVPGTHLHVVALTSGTFLKSFLCGGSLISTRTILTAAHCIAFVYKRNSLSSSLRATVGTIRWQKGGTEYTLARNVTHPHYVPGIFTNDIGILITSTAVELNNLVQTVPVTYDFIPQGVKCKVAGWGLTEPGGETVSPILFELDLITIDGEDCKERVARAAVELNLTGRPIEPHIDVCTLHSVGYGTCNGDSGSALRRVDDGHQFGVVSWGFPCAHGAPDMFTRISAFKDWMEDNIVE